MKQTYNSFPIQKTSGDVWSAKIINAVLQYSGLKKYHLLLVNNKSAKIHRLRAIAMWLTFRLTDLSLRQISEIYRCSRDNVYTAIRGIKIKQKTHEETNSQIKAIEEVLIPISQ